MFEQLLEDLGNKHIYSKDDLLRAFEAGKESAALLQVDEFMYNTGDYNHDDYE